MQRACMGFLQEWLRSDDRKPLIIRGARQVGKTWIVRHLAQVNQRSLIELNFEKKPELASLFSSNDPHAILLNLSAFSGDIDPQKAILFLDEIQAVPELLPKLRWFAEDMPELPVIAAGSLLEFILAEHTFSMPVGRINYMHLEPLSFEEFIQAKEKDQLRTYIKRYQIETTIPVAIHNELMSLFKEYIIIGGMPQAVKSWITKNSLKDVYRIQHDLIATYRDDFNKYNGRLLIERINEVMTSVPLFLGEKFMYSKVNHDVQSTAIKQALDLLCKAKVCYKVLGSAGNGVPLAAEIQEKYVKVLLLDVGLCSALLGLALDQLNTISEIDLVNKGGISEQVVGQILRTIIPFYIEPALYYWHRSEKGSNAEIDYLIQYKNNVIPVEVKSGSAGSLKSLHLFMDLKQYPLAVRINTDMPTQTVVQIKKQEGKPIQYSLLSLPYYLLGELPRMLDKALLILLVALFCGSLSAAQPVFMQHASSGIHDAVSKMSLRDKISQMMMIRVGLISTEQEREYAHELVEKYHVGGIFLATTPTLSQGVDEEMRQANCTMAKAKELIDSLQAASDNSLLVGMDCEWGTAMRLVDGIQIPYNMALAGIQDLDTLRRVGAIVGHQSMQLGIHCLGVVVDVNSNSENPVIGVRSFGSDPATVSRSALAMIDGMQQAGCIVAAKHFCGHQDGHGNTKDDSHCMLPLVDDMQVSPATTFQDAIDAGVDAIMTAHVDVRCLTKVEREGQHRSELSATMSHSIITDKLKAEMGFQGIVMTDALDMLGIAAYYQPWEAAAQAVLAGNDIVLFPLEVPTCIEYIEQQVRDGFISESLIDKAVAKILQAKAFVQIEMQRHAVLDQEEVQNFVRQVYRDTIALTEYVDTSITPIIPENVRYVICGPILECFRQNLFGWITLEQFVSEENLEDVRQIIFIISLPARGKLSAQAKELLQQVREQMIKSPGSLAVILGNPYAAYELADVGPVLVGFDIHPLAQQTVLEILQSRAIPKAIFPIKNMYIDQKKF